MRDGRVEQTGHARGRVRGARRHVGSPSSSATPRCCPASRPTGTVECELGHASHRSRLAARSTSSCAPSCSRSARRRSRRPASGRAGASRRPHVLRPRTGGRARSLPSGEERAQPEPCGTDAMAGRATRSAVSVERPRDVIPRSARGTPPELAGSDVSPDPPTSRSRIVVAVCVALAVASLAIPATLAYDAWAWLVWGREVGHLQLDTVGGPSWKPLPVVVTTVLSPFGERRADAVAGRLARPRTCSRSSACTGSATRFAGHGRRTVAVALLLVLTPDGEARFLRVVLEGHTAPMTAALAVWAIERHLAGRHRPRCCSCTALALDRPEAWPFLFGYARLAVATTSRAARGWSPVVCSPSCRCSGSAVTGGDRAARGTAPTPRRSSPTTGTDSSTRCVASSTWCRAPRGSPRAFAVVVRGRRQRARADRARGAGAIAGRSSSSR